MSGGIRRGASTVLALAVLALAACAPAAAELRGGVAPRRALPRATAPTSPTRAVFRWSFRDEELSAQGDGAARLAPPDSARLDLVLEGGFVGATAFVFGPTVVARIPMAERLVPPAALFWGMLGRLAVPPGDTTVRVDGDTLRADVGATAARYRVAWVRDTIVLVERIADGRIVERATREGPVIRYRHLATRRSLDLTLLRQDPVPPFDASIWDH